MSKSGATILIDDLRKVHMTLRQCIKLGVLFAICGFILLINDLKELGLILFFIGWFIAAAGGVLQILSVE